MVTTESTTNKADILEDNTALFCKSRSPDPSEVTALKPIIFLLYRTDMTPNPYPAKAVTKPETMAMPQLVDQRKSNKGSRTRNAIARPKIIVIQALVWISASIGLSKLSITGPKCFGPVFISDGCRTKAKNIVPPTQTTPGTICRSLKNIISAFTAVSFGMSHKFFVYLIERNSNFNHSVNPFTCKLKCPIYISNIDSMRDYWFNINLTLTNKAHRLCITFQTNFIL